VNTTAFIMFLGIVAITLGITYWASKQTKTAGGHFVAGGGINGWQNGLAISGDYVSAASFLGISGAIALSGYNGFYLAVGVPIAYLLVLLIVAEPLRNLGRYTMADMIAVRFPRPQVRGAVAINTLIISVVYMIVQFVGAGALVQLLLGIPYPIAVTIIGVLMIIYTLFGGMLATTWIQITKTVLLLTGAILLLILVIRAHGWNPRCALRRRGESGGSGDRAAAARELRRRTRHALTRAGPRARCHGPAARDDPIPDRPQRQGSTPVRGGGAVDLQRVLPAAAADRIRRPARAGQGHHPRREPGRQPRRAAAG
jgi:Na+(H+)/acetate symporter ActP